MNLGLQGTVAIVTGSSEGIGYATAHALAQEGVRVVLCARRQSLLVEARDTIAKETGADLLAVPCDVQQLPDVQRLVTAIMQRFGTIHILVNNAGSVPPHEFIDVDDAKWHQMLEGKLLSYIRVTRRYSDLVNRCCQNGGCFDEVIPRFHVVPRQVIQPAIYSYSKNELFLEPHTVSFLRDYGSVIESLAIGSWVRFTGQYTNAPRLPGGSSMAAIIFKALPQLGQCSTSTSKTRLSSRGQLMHAGAPCP